MKAISDQPFPKMISSWTQENPLLKIKNKKIQGYPHNRVFINYSFVKKFKVILTIESLLIIVL